ncbi:MAG TPA: hypothetical protein VL651_05015 [Bacteroidia bacterium]|nr:hypothetical protein [Bacteroidia bacterium]
MKKECTSCGMEIDEKAEVCPICQYEFPARRNYRPLLLIMLIIIFVMMCLNWLRPLLHLHTK